MSDVNVHTIGTIGFFPTSSKSSEVFRNAQRKYSPGKILKMERRERYIYIYIYTPHTHTYTHTHIRIKDRMRKVKLLGMKGEDFTGARIITTRILSGCRRFSISRRQFSFLSAPLSSLPLYVHIYSLFLEIFFSSFHLAFRSGLPLFRKHRSSSSIQSRDRIARRKSGRRCKKEHENVVG